MALDIFGRLLTKDEIEQSPSRRDQPPISSEKEKKLRKDSCAFIAAIGQDLEISQIAIATASVYFHCFYARLSFGKYDRYEVAATCIFLAGKVEEKRKRVDHVIKAYYAVKNTDKRRMPPYECEEWVKLRNTIYHLECILLDVIEYNFQVRHPYAQLLKFLNALFGPSYAHKSDKWLETKLKGKGGIRQSAWFFINDSLRSTLCLQYSPSTIAVAAIHLTLKHQKLDVRKKALPETEATETAKPWYEELFNEKAENLEEIGASILQSINTEEPPVKKPRKSKDPQKPHRKRKRVDSQGVHGQPSHSTASSLGDPSMGSSSSSFSSSSLHDLSGSEKLSTLSSSHSNKKLGSREDRKEKKPRLSAVSSRRSVSFPGLTVSSSNSGSLNSLSSTSSSLFSGSSPSNTSASSTSTSSSTFTSTSSSTSSTSVVPTHISPYPPVSTPLSTPTLPLPSSNSTTPTTASSHFHSLPPYITATITTTLGFGVPPTVSVVTTTNNANNVSTNSLSALNLDPSILPPISTVSQDIQFQNNSQILPSSQVDLYTHSKSLKRHHKDRMERERNGSHSSRGHKRRPTQDGRDGVGSGGSDRVDRTLNGELKEKKIKMHKTRPHRPPGEHSHSSNRLKPSSSSRHHRSRDPSLKEKIKEKDKHSIHSKSHSSSRGGHFHSSSSRHRSKSKGHHHHHHRQPSGSHGHDPLALPVPKQSITVSDLEVVGVDGHSLPLVAAEDPMMTAGDQNQFFQQQHLQQLQQTEGSGQEVTGEYPQLELVDDSSLRKERGEEMVQDLQVSESLNTALFSPPVDVL